MITTERLWRYLLSDQLKACSSPPVALYKYYASSRSVDRSLSSLRVLKLSLESLFVLIIYT